MLAGCLDVGSTPGSIFLFMEGYSRGRLKGQVFGNTARRVKRAWVPDP